MKVPVAKLEMENHKNEDSFLGLVLDMDKVRRGYFLDKNRLAPFFEGKKLFNNSFFLSPKRGRTEN